MSDGRRVVSGLAFLGLGFTVLLLQARCAALRMAAVASAERLTEPSRAGISVRLPEGEAVISHWGGGISSWKRRGPSGPFELIADSALGFLQNEHSPSLRPGAAPDGTVLLIGNLDPRVTAEKRFTFGDADEHLMSLILTNRSRADVFESPKAGLTLGYRLGGPPEGGRPLTRAMRVLKPSAGAPVFQPLPVGEWDGAPAAVLLDTRFFTALVDTSGSAVEKVEVLRGSRRVVLHCRSRSLAPGESLEHRLPFFFGPKDCLSPRTPFGLPLDGLLEFGALDFIARPALRLLGPAAYLTGSAWKGIVLVAAAFCLLTLPLGLAERRAAAPVEAASREELLRQLKRNEPWRAADASPAKRSLFQDVSWSEALRWGLHLLVLLALRDVLAGCWDLQGVGAPGVANLAGRSAALALLCAAAASLPRLAGGERGASSWAAAGLFLFAWWLPAGAALYLLTVLAADAALRHALAPARARSSGDAARA